MLKHNCSPAEITYNWNARVQQGKYVTICTTRKNTLRSAINTRNNKSICKMAREVFPKLPVDGIQNM